MKIKAIYYSSHFENSFKKLPKSLKRFAVEKEKIFRLNCFDGRLKTHKLRGEFGGYWSFSVNYSCRIIFEFIDGDEVGFVDIGDHTVYR